MQPDRRDWGDSTGTNGSSYTNDLDGDTLTGGGRAEAWDSQNRMI